MIELTPIQRRALRAAAHPLHPIVSVSQNGLSASVVKEIDRSLTAHELIKVKLYGVERDDRATLLAEICAQLGCAPVQQIGNTLVLWRPKPEPTEGQAPTTRAKTKSLTKKQAAMVQEGHAVPTRKPRPAKPATAAKAAPTKAPRRRTVGTTGAKARTPRTTRT